MDDLRKVSSLQLYKFWLDFSAGLLVLIAVMAFSHLLPFFLSPVVALVGAAVLYTRLYNARTGSDSSCMVIHYSLFFCLIVYSFVTIIITVLFAWGFVFLPQEFIFFNDPYLPSLWLNPISFLTMAVVYFRRHSLRICVECKLRNGDTYERGTLGSLLSTESHFQIKNLLILFGILSAIVWGYYLIVYTQTNTNGRDWYIFLWITIITFVLDEVYFIFRYYNLYLDLKESNEIITPGELSDMTAKTYLRFYVIAGNSIYVDKNSIDPSTPYMGVIDTPFFTKRSVNGITLDEVSRIVSRLTGGKAGELRFFFGRRHPDIRKHSVLRYFYFLDGAPEDYPDMNVNGDWMDFDKLKHLYSVSPGKLASIMVSDITRLATIILTEKTFDERGYRKNKIKSYQPSFNLIDVRHSELDFQDDKWIKISLFNSDTPFYGIKRWLRSVSGNDGIKISQ